MLSAFSAVYSTIPKDFVFMTKFLFVALCFVKNYLQKNSKNIDKSQGFQIKNQRKRPTLVSSQLIKYLPPLLIVIQDESLNRSEALFYIRFKRWKVNSSTRCCIRIIKILEIEKLFYSVPVTNIIKYNENHQS